MVNTRGWRLLGAGMCIAALALAGCGGGGGEESAEDADYEGPLAEFFGWDEERSNSDQEASEEERQQHYEVQEYVVTCMQEAGFEYHPEPFWGDQEDQRNVDDPFEEAWALQEEDPEAFAKQYGYGTTTIEYGDQAPVETEDPSDDPNWVYQESLSEAARAEYEKALWGDWEAVETEGPDGEPAPVDPSEVGGCYNEAQEEVYGYGEEQSQFDDLWQKMDEMHQQVESDSRMVEAKRLWSDCMAEAGYPDLEDLYAGQELVYERQSELYGWDEEQVGGAEEAEDSEDSEDSEGSDDSDDLEGSDDSEGSDSESAPPTSEPVEPDPAAVAELRQFELDVAWADFECKRDHDIERIEREVRFEHEERFIEENRAELEAYRDWQNEQGFGGQG